MTDPLRAPETDDEPWAVVEDDPMRKTLVRDALIAGLAGLVILALLAWVGTR